MAEDQGKSAMSTRHDDETILGKPRWTEENHKNARRVCPTCGTPACNHIYSTRNPAGSLDVLEDEMSKRYEIRNEIAPDGETTIQCAYNLNGDYIGGPDTAKYLCDERGIAPETIHPGASICSIGFCEREQKWYGWSHRAIYGFGIGDTVKAGDCAYTAATPEELIEQHVQFFADEILYPDEEKRNAKADVLRAQCKILPNGRGIIINDPGIEAEAVVLGSTNDIASALSMLEASDHIAPQPTQLVEAHEKVVLCGRGEWTAGTLEDAKQMACDFASGVS